MRESLLTLRILEYSAKINARIKQLCQELLNEQKYADNIARLQQIEPLGAEQTWRQDIYGNVAQGLMGITLRYIQDGRWIEPYTIPSTGSEADDLSYTIKHDITLRAWQILKQEFPERQVAPSSKPER